MNRREKAKRFEDLEVWKKAHQLVLNVYQFTKDFPPEEKFGLISQMRKAAVSIPANIADGFKKRTLRDKSHFYNIAQCSVEELRYYFILAKDIGFVKENQKWLSSTEEIGRMLYSLIRSIR